ncbi:DNA-binding protein [Leifsonia sp. H3M29-4]|uniref:DNA-binding protein n=1 Tax=Salinibacterium metalliresistens TaxID=3031321 RepID=UPI0023D9EA69|nr:DNA-binding protein [Salinibacterium metalliresistens]MDF1479012.1 DNA-binding protein [Salinibacterium metalliresistens]
MFVVTADQINSRHSVDAVAEVIEGLSAELGEGLTLPPDRSAGDEVQLLTADASTALRALLLLTRTRRFSVGLGVGAVRRPLGNSIRESTGEAFIAARTAVGRAKGKPSRFAVEGAESAADVEALVDLLLLLRNRRTEEGWQLYDLRVAGLTQAEAAKRLAISPQAASDRARAADLKAEFAATAPLARLVARLGEETS